MTLNKPEFLYVKMGFEIIIIDQVSKQNLPPGGNESHKESFPLEFIATASRFITLAVNCLHTAAS